MKNIILAIPSEKHQNSFLASLSETRDIEPTRANQILQGRSLVEFEENFSKFLRDLLSKQRVRTPNKVPEIVYWGLENGEYVGRISIRLELDAWLGLGRIRPIAH